MGRVRTKTVKRSARVIVERYYSKLTLDFDNNKRTVDEVTVVPSKRMRNKIAGFVTHLMRRIERGDKVRGISLKLQEEERERRMDYVPEVSAIDKTNIRVDSTTKQMLDKLNLSFPVTVEDASAASAVARGVTGTAVAPVRALAGTEQRV
eukprot:CAMPEP_0185579100 /NCGR_PEP_ID=MMETSP0434-20130131/13568_1 /TAXON_ID=626734 ORGANISM="Favella taraikaensis, Strain Fe Narragansett Bay" /NCGR_SAMPLE_ID=MMETSP0434 /ASSEMBLY_ACC=CAM_ASM_000379 /LENGTH=149 /DNA_ID=CAMNT_0028197053 /DNA_START=26 /DNA_END=476 /DNA_ORIENTATION=+